jgi:uncharacterized membrane protein YhaH (DUF805 family)
MNWRDLFTSFDGRISRKPFIVGMIVLSVSALFGMALTFVLGFSGMPFVLTIALLILIPVATIFPSIALVAKRLHDRNRPASWAAYFFVPVYLDFGIDALRIVADSTPLSVIGSVAGLVSLGATIWLCIEGGILPGTTGLNRYGPDPLASTPSSAKPGNLPSSALPG